MNDCNEQVDMVNLIVIRNTGGEECVLALVYTRPLLSLWIICGVFVNTEARKVLCVAISLV